MLSRVVSGIYNEALRPLGIQVSQLNILVAVGYRQPVSPIEVSERLCLDKSTMSRNLERLVERGWIGVEDSRPQYLRLTLAGEQILEQALPLWEAAQGQAAHILGPKGAKRLVKVANRLRQSDSIGTAAS